ncbi:MAG TPA: FMN-binding protein [Bacillota bacterium]|nr:FMN-binding protein [Bacillota bacterium]HPW40127.1 FMN-binding protein [Bacillota bacterium]
MKSRRRIVLAAVIALAAIIIAVFGAKSYIEASLVKLTETSIPDVDLSKIADGVYKGSHKVFPVEAEVRVTIENHKIIGIELVKHFNGQGTAAEVIPDRVTEAQSLKVDIVSGATYSSKVILKAIENALQSANR